MAFAVRSLSPVSMTTRIPHVLQLAHGLRAVFLDYVGDGDYAKQSVACGEEERRFALRGERAGLRFERVRYGCAAADESVIAAAKRPTVERRGKSVARQRLKIGDFIGLQVLFPRALQDGFGERVLALFFQREGAAQQFRFRRSLRGENVGDLRLARGDRSGLVERDELDAGRFLRATRPS